MLTKNLWGDLANLAVVRTPKQILMEQAALLTNATGGLLTGHVAESGDHRRKAIAYDLDVVVPTMNNYTYTILYIWHEIELYPVRVVQESRVSTCPDEESYMTALADILSSDKTKLVLSRLLSQAR